MDVGKTHHSHGLECPQPLEQRWNRGRRQNKALSAIFLRRKHYLWLECVFNCNFKLMIDEWIITWVALEQSQPERVSKSIFKYPATKYGKSHTNWSKFHLKRVIYNSKFAQVSHQSLYISLIWPQGYMSLWCTLHVATDRTHSLSRQEKVIEKSTRPTHPLIYYQGK